MRGQVKNLLITTFVGLGLALLLVSMMDQAQPAVANPGTLYVALDGDDLNTCTSIENRCATVQHAVDVAQPGDEIRVAAGSYTDVSSRAGITQVVYISKTVLLQGGFTTDNWVTADPDANPTTLDAQGKGRVLVIRDAGPTIQGFILTGGGGYFSGGGINAESASTVIYNNQIIRNEANGDGGGIFINRGTAEISHNRIISNTAVWAGGLRIINDAEATIVNNEIRENVAQISGGGLEVDCCGGTIALISKNLIANNIGGAQGGGVWVMTTHARLVNNILIGNEATSGAGIWMGGMAAFPVSTTLLHNTLIGALAGDQGVWSSEYVTAALVNNIIFNYDTGITNTTPVSSTVTADHTLFYSNSTDYGGGVSSTNEVLGDPAFVDPPGGDFHIKPGSAALDTGVDAGVTYDFDGDPRPAGAGFDIGADEIVRRIYLPVLMHEGQP